MSILTLFVNRNTVYLDMNLVTIDWKNADMLFGRLVHAVRTRSFPFNEVEVPQLRKNIPDSIAGVAMNTLCFSLRCVTTCEGG